MSSLPSLRRRRNVASRIANVRDELADLQHRRAARTKTTKLQFPAWMQRYIMLRGVPFSFDGHTYLREPYEQYDHPHISARKGAQIGWSTMCLLWALWCCERFGAKALYYLATDRDAYDFSNDRIAPQIDGCPHLESMVRDVRARAVENVGLRHVGRGSLYCRGLVTRTNVKSVDGDILILDELDEADQENKAFAYDRLLHSALQLVRELSQPSIPEYGIDATFSASDQRYWHLRCPSCHRHTCLDIDHMEERGRFIPRHIRPVPGGVTWAKPGQEWYRACSHCAAPLDPEAGEWVPMFPDRSESHRGYHVSQLFRAMPRKGFADPADFIMDSLLRANRAEEKMRATISILGYPYAGDRAPITDQVLNAAEGDHGFISREALSGTYIGVDQGDMLHIVVGQDTPQGTHTRVVLLIVTDSWQELVDVCRETRCRVLVMDALPNKAKAKEVAAEVEQMRFERVTCSAYIQYFKGDTMARGEEGEDEKAVGKVNVDRTESLDQTTQEVAERRMRLPRGADLGRDADAVYQEFRSHLKMLVKDVVEDEKGVKRWVYKRNVANHFGMALNSMRIARELAPFSIGGAVGVGSGVDLTR